MNHTGLFALLRTDQVHFCLRGFLCIFSSSFCEKKYTFFSAKCNIWSIINSSVKLKKVLLFSLFTDTKTEGESLPCRGLR